MNEITFSTEHTGITEHDLKPLEEHLNEEIGRISAAWASGYDTEYASLTLPSDQDLLSRVSRLAENKKGLDPAMVIVAGIGGSNLGTLALMQALGIGNELLYCADTVDAPYIARLKEKADQHLQEGRQVIVIVISKSGSTTETIANAQVFVSLLKKHRADYHNYVVIISDDHSPLAEVAHEHSFSYLAIPKHVGGRYSVFSAVGLFPLALLGVDIEALRKGAQSMKEPCTALELARNPSALSAATLYQLYQKEFRIHDTFVIGHALFGIAQWYRQLMAESIGKSENKQGQMVHVGITPTTSIGSVDLHSVAQLYLAGPNIQSTTFISVANKQDVSVPSDTAFDNLVPMIQNRTLNQIMNAITKGVQKAYMHANRPFMTIELPEISAYHCGQLLQMKMVEIMYLGFLFDINPFNQPQVEWYKKETRKMLSHE